MKYAKEEIREVIGGITKEPYREYAKRKEKDALTVYTTDN